MRLSSKFVALPLAAALASAGLVTVSAAPTFASSLPICTKGAWLTAPNGDSLYLPATSSNSSSCYLAQGDVSSAVKALQDAMVTCYGQNIAIDGDFGPATEAALKNVQKDAGVTVDGVYGTQTRDGMFWVFQTPNPLGPCRAGGW
jgi:peptidoglycan hydrolase-like protein with peptidoglycan-binding domain